MLTTHEWLSVLTAGSVQALHTKCVDTHADYMKVETWDDSAFYDMKMECSRDFHLLALDQREQREHCLRPLQLVRPLLPKQHDLRGDQQRDDEPRVRHR